MALIALLLLVLGAAEVLELPVVDLAKSDWREKALDALQSHASFSLVGHGLGTSSSGAWGAALAASARAFALPEAQKAAAAAGPPSKEVPVVRGYFGLGAESGTKETRFECKEGLSLAAGDRSAALAPNRWPQGLGEAALKALEALPAQLRLLALRLADGLAEAAQHRRLLRPEDAAFLAGGGDGLEAFRVFHYLSYSHDRCGGRAAPGAELLWSSDHTDWGSLTIIAQDDSPSGIEIFREGRYQRLASKDGALIVNGGDYLELVSEGAVPSPLHRVREPPAEGQSEPRGRTSLVYFHYPAGAAPLRPRDVEKARERRLPLKLNTLTDGLENLDEATTFKSHLQKKWLGVQTKPRPVEEL